MQPVYLFDIAFQRAHWLSVRQATIAENVVNANTPHYRPREVEPFEAALNRTDLATRTTNQRHMSFEIAPTRPSSFESQMTQTVGNGVSVEKELIKAGETSREYSLNASIVKSFHRMWMSAVKG